ncbi:MAG: hypothetical protein L0H53_05275 [Candidatus Nitrosocosmicus sp.]|nr:hypothetical protein [Candidatus Nitrosocosmicus sp.]MDN5867090.1 hypothetical protein [Candidatus Nitrosocosmicus sp.]
MNIEITNKERQRFLFGKTGIASVIFIATMIFFSYQVSYAQLDSTNNFNSSSSSSGGDSNSSNETSISSLIEAGKVSSGSFSSFVYDINTLLADNSSKSISNGTTNSQTVIPSLNLLALDEIAIQNTSMSVPAPVRHPGQPSHEVVFALPLRNDGNIWSGTVTFTASKPIEVEVLHTYSPVENPDSTHGEPYHAVLPGNKSIAITHLRHLVDVPIEINGTGISSGSLNFAGNALVFHKTSGEPFTVTYTIDAIAKELTKLGK